MSLQASSVTARSCYEQLDLIVTTDPQSKVRVVPPHQSPRVASVLFADAENSTFARPFVLAQRPGVEVERQGGKGGGTRFCVEARVVDGLIGGHTDKSILPSTNKLDKLEG